MRSIIALAAFILLAAWTLSNAKAQEAGDFPNCAGWIPHQCSCTSNSCYRARPGEVEDLGNGSFRITATGEIIKRTEWSQDGRFMLCAFKRDENGTRWLTGPGQPIKCVFPPLPSS